MSEDEVKEPIQQPGVSQQVTQCGTCGAPVRTCAFPAPEDGEQTFLLVDADPAQRILPDAQVLPLFRPHPETCQGSKSRIVLPNGKPGASS